jgi:hypothetical protein
MNMEIAVGLQKQGSNDKVDLLNLWPKNNVGLLKKGLRKKAENKTFKGFERK